VSTGLSLSRLRPYVWRGKKYLVLAVAASLLSSLANSLTPLVAKEAVDAVVSRNLQGLLLPVVAIVVLACVRGAFSFVQRVNARRLAEMVSLDLRVDVYRKLRELPLTYLYEEGAGRLVARVTGDVEEIKRVFMFGLSALSSNVFILILALAAMVSINPLLAAFSLSILLPLVVVLRVFVKKIRARFREAREEYGRMSSTLREALVGIETLKALGAERFAEGRFARHNSSYRDRMVEVGRLRAIVWPTLTALTNLALLVVYWLGGLGIVEETVSVGDLIALAMYVSMISWPISSLGLFVVVAETARVAASRVFEILDAEVKVKEAPDAKPLNIERGEVVFEDVWFSYDGKTWVLRGLNLKVKPGEFVAITGPPGSGKSTLALLLLRFFDPQRGRILIDGVDIRKVTLDSLRRQVVVVHQDIYLFPDTIRNNIAYAKPDASPEEVVKAAKLARIHDFVSSLPEGYDTPVGERGVTLSGGQRQRMALARALLANPRIILLDDTTSEVDAETEKAIWDALTRFFKGKTLIVITQRPSTMALADRIVVIEDGRVVEERLVG